jgi:hypothetical protein
VGVCVGVRVCDIFSEATFRVMCYPSRSEYWEEDSIISGGFSMSVTRSLECLDSGSIFSILLPLNSKHLLQ